jgi:hypothetical protein
MLEGLMGEGNGLREYGGTGVLRKRVTGKVLMVDDGAPTKGGSEAETLNLFVSKEKSGIFLTCLLQVPKNSRDDTEITQLKGLERGMGVRRGTSVCLLNTDLLHNLDLVVRDGEWDQEKSGAQPLEVMSEVRGGGGCEGGSLIKSLEAGRGRNEGSLLVGRKKLQKEKWRLQEPGAGKGRMRDCTIAENVENVDVTI